MMVLEQPEVEVIGESSSGWQKSLKFSKTKSAKCALGGT